MSKHKDKISGGLADDKQPRQFDKKKLEAGIKVEMEHTSDRSIAKEIAMDHLTEDPDYYEKLKTIEKQDRLEVTTDGKQELDVGVEPLDKLKSRWNKLKKALDSDKAIMEIAGQEYDPDEDSDSQQDAQQPQGQEEQQEQPEQQEEPEQTDEDQGEEESDTASEQKIEEALRDEGYSDAEIAHILHGHILPEATVDDHKAKNEMIEGQIDQQNMLEDAKMEREHKKRMQDLEHEKAKSELADPEVEKNHRKRTLDLEL
jgi:sulfur carrier protein ThiS